VTTATGVEVSLYLSLASVVLGMIRPVYVLWFLDRGNRLKVMNIYGTAAILFFVSYKLIIYIVQTN